MATRKEKVSQALGVCGTVDRKVNRQLKRKPVVCQSPGMGRDTFRNAVNPLSFVLESSTGLRFTFESTRCDASFKPKKMQM